MRIYLCKIKTRNEGGFTFHEPDLPADVINAPGVTISQRLAQNGNYAPKFSWCFVSLDGVADYTSIDAVADNFYLDSLPLETILNNGQKNAIQNKIDTFGIAVDVGAATTLGDVVNMIKAVMV